MFDKYHGLTVGKVDRVFNTRDSLRKEEGGRIFVIEGPVSVLPVHRPVTLR